MSLRALDSARLGVRRGSSGNFYEEKVQEAHALFSYSQHESLVSRLVRIVSIESGFRKDRVILIETPIYLFPHTKYIL